MVHKEPLSVNPKKTLEHRLLICHFSDNNAQILYYQTFRVDQITNVSEKKNVRMNQES